MWITVAPTGHLKAILRRSRKLNCKRLSSPLALRCCRLRTMNAAHKAASDSNLQYQIKKILTTKELQNAVNLLMNWLHSGELRISYYHFILICDILQSIGIKINNDEIGFQYAAAYLLLSKAEDIMNISIGRSSYETNQKISEIIYAAVHDSLVSLDMLNSYLFTSS